MCKSLDVNEQAKMSKSKVNFTPFEKDVLLELVEEQKDIIESKKNSGKMVQKKKRIVG